MEFDVLDIVQHVLNIALLYVLLRAILYKPVREYMLKREEETRKELERADAVMREANELKAQNEALLAQANTRAREIADEKAAYAEKLAQATIDDAHKEAAQIIVQAREQIRVQKQEAQDQLLEQTAALAVDLATRILGREISLEDNERLIDEYFHKVG